jgi:hypothetical protein
VSLHCLQSLQQVHRRLQVHYWECRLLLLEVHCLSPLQVDHRPQEHYWEGLLKLRLLLPVVHCQAALHVLLILHCQNQPRSSLAELQA